MDTTEVLVHPRFLALIPGSPEQGDTNVAIAELIANAWDSGAREVLVHWPSEKSPYPFCIRDDGDGMTEAEFTRRWRTLMYDRHEEQGPYAEAPELEALPKRPAFARNGMGRFAAFRIGDGIAAEYTVQTWKQGQGIRYRVSRSNTSPVVLKREQRWVQAGHGTEILGSPTLLLKGTEQELRAQIALRFLGDPRFTVKMSGTPIALHDVPEKQRHRVPIEVDGVADFFIDVIDTSTVTSRVKHFGVAWHVENRLVGKCSWDDTKLESFFRAAEKEAASFLVIVRANRLRAAVDPDWMGFKLTNPTVRRAYEKAQDIIESTVRGLLEKREIAALGEIKKTYKDELAALGPTSREKFSAFMTSVSLQCTSITRDDLARVAALLTQLEIAQSQYQLIKQLHTLNPRQLEELRAVLDDWTTETAKIVLDEIRKRILLVDELKRVLVNDNVHELHELQPVFFRGLWIFGPEFETIEYTANQGMTTVIQDLFGKYTPASRNRPDFAILTDSTVGLYSLHRFEEEGGEEATDRLVVIELKRPGIRLGREAKTQCWKYVAELYNLGKLDGKSMVRCFVVGSEFEEVEAEPTLEKHGRVTIKLLAYETVLARARGRLLNLLDRVDAPFRNRQ